MADLTFASYLQGPLGESIRVGDNMGLLEAPTFEPRLTLPGIAPDPIKGPGMRLLGPGDVAGLAAGAVVRMDPPPSSVDAEPNYLAVVELVPPELPWVLTPARAEAGRLRPWLVLVVLEDATAPIMPGTPLPTVQAAVKELPDLRDSWGWAHVQRTAGTGTLPGGGAASRAAVARLVCPRRLDEGVTYRACLVPAFKSGIAAGLGDPNGGDAPNDLAWNVDADETVQLPVYHHWRFTTGPSGDFEELVTRLRPADPEALRQASARQVDIRAPWPDGGALAEEPQLVAVQGALVPFAEPPAPALRASDGTLAAFDTGIRQQLNAPAHRLDPTRPEDTTGTLAPPLYGGRHVSQSLVEGDPAWLAQLNISVANRIAAGLGAEYVRANQEDLMAKAWQQVGAIREANRLRATVELTTNVAERMHAQHVAPLGSGEVVALAAPASARMRTSDSTTLAMEARMSVMDEHVASSAFARRVRPAGKLARRAGVSIQSTIPKALAGNVSVPAPAPVIPDSATTAATEVASEVAATQLVTMAAMVQVASLNAMPDGADALDGRLRSLALGDDVTASIQSGSFGAVASAIADQVTTVTEFTSGVLGDMREGEPEFGSLTPLGVPISDAGIAARVVGALQPGDSHHARADSQLSVPERLSAEAPGAPVMAYPRFPVPTALALVESNREWFISGLGALAANCVALLHLNAQFIESYLVGMNHEMMRELLWREYPTDFRGTPFTRFWPRPEEGADIPEISSWSDATPLGSRLADAQNLAVLLIRGDVIRRYPGMVVTAVRAAPQADSSLRPDQNQPPLSPSFVIEVDEDITAYAFSIQSAELTAEPTVATPGWFFVLAEHGHRIRFGFDIPPGPDEAIGFASWDEARWPTPDGGQHPSFVPMRRGHVVAGEAFAPSGQDPLGRAWNRDSADVARITLQRPYRVAIHAAILLRSP
jgi:hypothetical protein